MPRIINLSTLHTLHPISTGVEAFTRLCDEYSRSGCFNFCPSIFTKLTNKAWVMYIYQKNLNSVINPYKLGKINTKQFLDGMLGIFNFLEDETISFSEIDRNRIEINKDKFLSIKGKSERSRKDIALALLEEAWNNIIDFSDEDALKIGYLLQENSEEPTYLISNTNELNIHKILCAWKQKFPTLEWKEVDLSVDSGNGKECIEVAPNVFLCLSYKVHAFKTTEENRELQATTPSLLRYLVGELDSENNSIQVISQFGKDREEAERLGIPKSNIFIAKDYFSACLKAKEESTAGETHAMGNVMS